MSDRRKPVDEVSTVSEAARVLGLREFDFFRLAYRRWFGSQPDEKTLEKIFVAYMLRQRVPGWVRHLSREVLDRRREGRLDPEAIGAGRYRDRPQRHPQGRLYFALTLAAWFVLFGLLVESGGSGVPSGPAVGCPGTTGSRFFEEWVYLISGNQPPPCDALVRRH